MYFNSPVIALSLSNSLQSVLQTRPYRPASPLVGCSARQHSKAYPLLSHNLTTLLLALCKCFSIPPLLAHSLFPALPCGHVRYSRLCDRSLADHRVLRADRVGRAQMNEHSPEQQVTQPPGLGARAERGQMPSEALHGREGRGEMIFPSPTTLQ